MNVPLSAAEVTMLDPTTAWAKDVVEGRIVSGDLMRRACERHLRDIVDGPKRGIYWRPDKAQHALGFFPAVLTVSAGAHAGEPFELPSYMTFVVGSIFGWMRENGLRRFKTAWVESAKGQAKALAIDTPIATPSGWSMMGELKDGDEVFDEKGSICRVVKAHDIVTDGECYSVKFDDGSEIVANSSHLWFTEQRRSIHPNKGGAMRGVPLSERGAWKFGLRTTEEIARTLTYSNGKYQSANHSIQLCGALNTKNTDLPIPPYTYGVWCGDGDSDSARLTVAVKDWEIVERVSSEGVPWVEQKRHAPHIARISLSTGKRSYHDSSVEAATIGYALERDTISAPEVSLNTGAFQESVSKYIRNSALFIQVSKLKGKGNGGGTTAARWKIRRDKLYDAIERLKAISVKPIICKLRELGVLGDKHIPLVYMRASALQRAELLRGLMDSDGTIDETGNCAFTVTNRRLAEDFCALVTSLGIKTFFRVERAVLNGRYIGPKYVVVFNPPHEFPVFHLKRKLARQIKRHDRRRLAGDRRIVSCERITSVPVRCITVDSSSGMFLAGESLVPTHNSPLASGIGLYIMGFCGIPRAEVYAIAKDRFQANVLFGDAVAMCRTPIPGQEHLLEEARETLESRGDVIIRGIGDNAWKIEHPSSGSRFQSLAGDEAVSGPRPVMVAADEIHEWKSGRPIEIWQASLAKMHGDSLMWLSTNTPAADHLVGTEYSETYQRILRGEIEDDASFAMICRVDTTDKPLEDESCWKKALPCLGITFPIDNVRDEVISAKHRIAKSLTVQRLYFGVPVGTSEYWIDLDAWEAVQGKVNPDEMKGRSCWLSLDLSQKNDLTALGIGWRVDNVLHATVRYWKPQERLSEAAKIDGAQYVEWAATEPPLLYAVPGRAIEYDYVAVEVQKVCAENEVELMAVDPAFLTEFRKACDRIGLKTWVYDPKEQYPGDGLKLVVHGQGAQGMTSEKALWMPRSLQKLEDMILTKGIVIDESPVTKWCAGNAAVHADAKNNRWIVKKRQRGRIDGLTVLAMLAGAADAENAGKKAIDWYSDPDFPI